MGDVRDGAELALETEDVGGLHPEQRLERHIGAAKPIVSVINDPHAARPEAGADLEAVRAAEPLGGRTVSDAVHLSCPSDPSLPPRRAILTAHPPRARAPAAMKAA